MVCVDWFRWRFRAKQKIDDLELNGRVHGFHELSPGFACPTRYRMGVRAGQRSGARMGSAWPGGGGRGCGDLIISATSSAALSEQAPSPPHRTAPPP